MDMNKIIAIATLAPVALIIVALCDLRINKWQWENKHRYCFIMTGVIINVWLVKKTTIVWPHVVTAVVALYFLIQDFRSWHGHKKIGGTFTLPQLAVIISIGLASIYVFRMMILRIAALKGIMF